MKTSDLEQRMKTLLEEQEYIPGDAGWDKMQQALAPPAARKLLFLFPAWKAAAAIAVILITVATGSYLFLKEKPQQPTISHNQQQKAAQPVAGPAIEKEKDRQQPGLPEPVQAKEKIFAAQPHKKFTRVDTGSNANASTIPEPYPVPEPQVATTVTKEKNTSIPKQQPVFPYYKETKDNHRQPGQSERAFNLGIAANIGKPSLGNVQYNVGVVARQPITDKIFAEANISLASTRVNYAEQLPYLNESWAVSGTRQYVDVNYTSNIIAIGFAPSIGIKATRNVSLSVGGDVYKSLNRTLLPERTEALTTAMDGIIVPNRNVTNWDAGIKAQLDYMLGPKFSVNTQYRQGLTQYILIDGKSFKNSIFNIGLKYYIGR